MKDWWCTREELQLDAATFAFGSYITTVLFLTQHNSDD